MNSNILKSKEMKISNFFNKESSSYDLEMSSTAQAHVDVVCESNAKSVIDVGSGPGNILLEMLNNGVEFAIGVDLASDMNEIARKRILEAEIDDNRFKIIDGSFLELTETNYLGIQKLYDAVSLHLVLCCHPDREDLLNQSIKFKPDTIVLTVPRTWVFTRVIVGFWGFISKLRGNFRPYIHSQRSIDTQLFEAGYELINRKKKLIVVMSSYSFQESKDKSETLAMQSQHSEEFS